MSRLGPQPHTVAMKATILTVLSRDHARIMDNGLMRLLSANVSSCPTTHNLQTKFHNFLCNVCSSPVVDCGLLSSPINGDVAFSSTTFGSTATYSCSPGFILQGFSRRVCTSDGTWSDSEPTCVRKCTKMKLHSMYGDETSYSCIHTQPY